MASELTRRLFSPAGRVGWGGRRWGPALGLGACLAEGAASVPGLGGEDEFPGTGPTATGAVPSPGPGRAVGKAVPGHVTRSRRSQLSVQGRSKAGLLKF